MYKEKYVRYLNLTTIPDDIIAELPADINLYNKNTFQNYHWTDSFNKKLNEWAQHHICNDMYFAFQIMTGDLPIHKDIDTKTKLVYLLQSGGNNVVTKFWDDDKNLLDTYNIEKHRWHILKVDTYHSVEGIEENKFRWSITAKIF